MWRKIAATLWSWLVSLLWFIGWLIWAYFIKPNLWIVILSIAGILIAFLGSIYAVYRLIKYWWRRRKPERKIEVEEVGNDVCQLPEDHDGSED